MSTAGETGEFWYNFEISRVVFMPNDYVQNMLLFVYNMFQ